MDINHLIASTNEEIQCSGHPLISTNQNRLKKKEIFEAKLILEVLAKIFFGESRIYLDVKKKIAIYWQKTKYSRWLTC